MLAFSPLHIAEWFCPLIAFLLTLLGLYLLLRSDLAARLAIDMPNHRSLHSVPIPRVGGIVLVPAFVLVWMVTGWGLNVAVLASALAVLSYLDDRSGLPVVLRLAGQFGAAAAFIWMELPSHGLAVAAIAILCIVWSTNLYNFMDGADGIAGGMGAFGFLALGIAAAAGGSTMQATVCLSISAACLGFLILNFPPARVFMGDAGSVTLGFLAGVLGLAGWRDGLWPLWFPILVFSPFVVDATVTLCKRAVKLEKVWVAHRDHYYQRLVRMGWSRRRLALSEYFVMAASAMSALLLLHVSRGSQLLGLLVWAVLYAAVLIRIDLCWKKYNATPA